MTRPLCLIGAGFNADAVREAGPIYGDSIYIGRHQVDCDYPLVAGAARLCFGLTEVPSDNSIEDLFSEALGRGDYFPVQRLSEQLMKADYYVAARLASASVPSCYRQFFERLNGAQFLTFNYDSLVETFLFRLGMWYPHDGFGVRVETALSPGSAEVRDQKSTSLVLHLHGSLCLYTSEFEKQRNPGSRMQWLVPRESPQYIFDPDSISANFMPYARVSPTTGYSPIERRVIAPVPDKAEGLQQAFVRETYARAINLLRCTGTLVAIGYSFGVHDRASYDPILQVLGASRDRRLLVVSPHAGQLAERLRAEYSSLNIDPIEETLKGWCSTSFQGL